MISTEITQKDYSDAPELIAMLMCFLMFRLGGQVTLTLGELDHIFRDYPHVRLTLIKDTAYPFEMAKEQLTVTLLGKDHFINDKSEEKG